MVERAVILAHGGEIGGDDIVLPAAAVPADDRIESHERMLIDEVLREAAGNISKAARRLGIDRSTLYRKIERYGLEIPGKGPRG